MKNRSEISAKSAKPFGLAHRFYSDLSGTITTLFSLLAPTVIVVTGLALDLGRANNVSAALQSAVDAAVLAVANDPYQTPAEMETLANAILDANLASTYSHNITSRNFSFVDNRINFEVSASVPTTLSQLVFISELEVDALANANPKVDGAEIVIALDTTGSMGFGNSWDDAKEAMADILVDLDEVATNNENFYATFFPFADRVNVGEDNAKSWLSVDVPPNGHWGNRLQASNTNKWCLEPRDELIDGNPNALTDKSPSELGFLPTAKNPPQDDYYVSYFAKYINYFTCSEYGIMGPTTDIASFTDTIEALPLRGTGRFDIGMAWAFRLLSPNWQDEWGVDGYPSAYGERRKIAVFISDAYTEAYRREVPNQTTSTQNPILGHNRGSVAGFENFVDVCNQMTDAGIEVHTIYVNGNSDGVPYMKECATNETEYYHEVSDITDLREALQSIANSVTDVSLTN